MATDMDMATGTATDTIRNDADESAEPITLSIAIMWTSGRREG